MDQVQLLKNEKIIMQKISFLILKAQGFSDLNPDAHDDIIKHRSLFIQCAQEFKNFSLPIYGERITGLIFAGVIFYADEIAYNKASIQNWHLMQEELLDRNDGGDQFYELCQEILNDPSLPLMVYKVFYIILMCDFKGIYFDDINHRNQIKQKFHYFIENNDVVIRGESDFDSSSSVLVLKNIFWTPALNKFMLVTTSVLTVIALGSYFGIYIYLLAG